MNHLSFILAHKFKFIALIVPQSNNYFNDASPTAMHLPCKYDVARFTRNDAMFADNNSEATSFPKETTLEYFPGNKSRRSLVYHRHEVLHLIKPQEYAR